MEFLLIPDTKNQNMKNKWLLILDDFGILSDPYYAFIFLFLNRSSQSLKLVSEPSTLSLTQNFDRSIRNEYEFE